MQCNTAIFYDIENLTGLFGAKTNTSLHLEEIYRRVLDLDGVCGVSVQKAYADWSLQQYRNLRTSILHIGIDAVQVFNTNLHDKVKNAADVCLIIDAVDLISKQPEIENYVIASGDGIYTFLAKKLHEHGKRVIGCGFEIISNVIFQNACDYFISLEKTDSSIVATSKRRIPNLLQVPVPLAEEEIKNIEPIIEPTVKIPKKFAKTKYSEAVASANIEIWKDMGDSSGCIHVVRKLVESVFIDSTKNMPGIEVSVFTTYLSHYLPGFKVTSHGFKRISEFIRFILTGSPYCIYSISDNVLLMAPREVAKGNIMEDIKGLLITTYDGSRYNSVFNVPTDEPFVYSITPENKAELLKPEKIEEHVEEKEDVKADSVRKFVKEAFDELSRLDALPVNEVKKLTTADYSRSKFGLKTPILKEISDDSNLTEERRVNGKVKYWKEPFKFNSKSYLIYKEWVASLHKNRFIKWLADYKND